MDKAGMIDVLQTLHLELIKRLSDEEHTMNNTEKVAEYKKKLLEIENEIKRISRQDRKNPG